MGTHLVREPPLKINPHRLTFGQKIQTHLRAKKNLAKVVIGQFSLF